MRFSPRRLIALLLLTVTFCGLLTSFSENVVCAGELPGVHESASATCDHDNVQPYDGGTPSAPDSHSSGDHICLGDCGCPCHAPLPSPLTSFTVTRSHTVLMTAESHLILPEVYLSLFVPPDIA